MTTSEKSPSSEITTITTILESPNGTSSSHRQHPIRHVSDIIGDWGPTPRKIFWFLFTCYIVSPFYFGSMVFVNDDPDFECIDPRIVFSEDGSSPYKQCTFIDIEGNKQQCQSFTFNTTNSLQRRSLIDEFELVCHRKWLLSAIQSSAQIGIIAAALIFGFVSDNFGRLTALKISTFLEFFLAVAQAFSPNAWVYIICRIFTGFASYGRYMNGYVLLLEWVGPKYRGSAPIMLEFAWIIGDFGVPAVFYFVSDFRIIQGTAAFLLIFWTVPLFISFLPESPRWQMTHGKHEEARENILQAVKRKENEEKFDETAVLEKIEELRQVTEDELARERKENISGSVLSVFKFPSMVKLCLILFYSWITHSFISYATYFNMGSMQVNMYLTYLTLTASYLTSTIFLLLAMNRFSRKTLLMANIFAEVIGFTVMFATSFSSSSYVKIVRVASSFLGIAATWNSFNLLYIFSTELFPTQMRQSAMGMCSLVARIGGLLAPFVKELSWVTHVSVPIAIYGILAAINFVLICFVPKMDDKEMPDSFGEAKEDIEGKD